MSTTFSPRIVNESPDMISKIVSRLREQNVAYHRETIRDDLHRVSVSPVHADVLSEALSDARAAKRREEEASLREAEASIDVGGLSVDDARRLVEALQDAPRGASVRDLPEDLQRLIGVAEPEWEAEVRVRFARNALPSRGEVAEYVHNALRTYFDEHERYCGLSDDVEGDDAIVGVTVREIRAAQDS